MIAERHPQTQEITPHSDEVILKHVGDILIPRRGSWPMSTVANRVVDSSPWERKVESNNCKTLHAAVGGRKEMFLAVNWFATVTLSWF